MVLLTGSKDFSARIWDSIGNFKHELSGYSMTVTAVAIDAAGRFAYTGSASQGVNLWDLDNPRVKLANYPMPMVNAIACAKNGTVYIGSSSTEISMLKYPTGLLPQKLMGSDGEIISLACSPSGKLLASGSTKGTILIWDVNTSKQVLAIPKAHSWKITSVAFSKDERFLVTGSNDGTAKLWDLGSGKLLATVENFGYNVRSVALSANNQWMAVAAYHRDATDFGIGLFDVKELTPAPPKPTPANKPPVKK
jgi:WD40 repeat protein